MSEALTDPGWIPQPITLTDHELYQITGKKRWSAQVRKLEKLHIPFKPRDDGKPIVFRKAAEQAMGVAHTTESRRAVTLNFDAL